MSRHAAVLGWPIAHSKSPPMIDAAFAAAGIDATMLRIGVPPEGLGAAIAKLRETECLGASVTVPHKVAVAALCDELSPAAAEIGAVNCVQFGAKLVGHNTDEGGFFDGLVAAGCDLRGKRSVVLGAGGSARAVAYALKAGRSVEVIARRPDDVTWAKALPWTPEQLRESFGRAELVVDCTPTALGTDEVAVVDALPLEALPGNAWVASLVYHRWPILLERAKASGYSTVDGRAMLLHQGARAFSIWTGLPAPIEEMRRALDASLAGT